MSWDVLVAGAGPAGAVAALVLARGGRRVALVDQVDPAAPKVGESLPGAARPLLSDLGLLDRVERGPHLPSSGNVSAWGSDDLRSADAIRSPHGPGWHLDRPRFDRDLREAARGAGAVFVPGRVRCVSRDPDGCRVELRAGGEPLHARWLIDATGRHAAVARGAGARRRRDAPLVALVAWLAPRPGDRDTRTLVEAAPDGWWYMALLPDGSRVVAYHVDAEEAAGIVRTEGAWAERLARTARVRRHLDAAAAEATPRTTDASGARLDRFHGDGWLAVGDAALSFDPLSSQGLFDALYTGLRGGEAVDAALTGDRSLAHGYGERLESVRAGYLRHHRVFYAEEARWPERPFWARRRGGPNAGRRAGQKLMVTVSPAPSGSATGVTV